MTELPKSTLSELFPPPGAWILDELYAIVVQRMKYERTQTIHFKFVIASPNGTSCTGGDSVTSRRTRPLTKDEWEAIEAEFAKKFVGEHYSVRLIMDYGESISDRVTVIIQETTTISFAK